MVIDDFTLHLLSEHHCLSPLPRRILPTSCAILSTSEADFRKEKE